MWDSQIWEDFTAIVDFLLWADLKKDEMMRNGEDVLDLTIAVEEEMEEAQEIIKRRMELSNISGIKLNTYTFFSMCSLSEMESFALILSAVSALDHKLNALLSAAEKGRNVQTPTVEMALRLYSLINPNSIKDVASLIDIKGDFGLCFNKEVMGKSKILSHETLVIKSSLLSYFLGKDFNIKYKGLNVKKPLPSMLIYDKPLEEAINVANSQKYIEKAVSLYIYGRKKSGKKLLVSHLSEKIKRPVVFVKWNDIEQMPYEKREYLLNDLTLKTRLENGFICLYDIPDFSDEKNQSNKSLFLSVIDICPFTVVIGEGKYYYPVWLTESFVSIELWDLSATEKIYLWSHYSNMYGAGNEINAALNGNKYIMSVGEIESTFETAFYLAASKNKPSIKTSDISDAVKQRGRGKLGSYATLIKGCFVWDDLIADEYVKRQMRYICNQIKYRNVVGEEWGFFEKTPYGRGVSVLFYGPPGTGKTMAVQIMAAELGLELYRVDLSKMVSKYIGETEKNITELFDRAKNMNVILFFDEADSLFAKRSEVKDSNDRNANAETAHLLQKMEEYEGMVILATNLMEQIDDAFKRRIKFMIPFRFPDASARRNLWHSLIPDKTPLEDGIDLDFFADQFELSGSQIKEILWNAAYIAVSDDKPLGNEEIKEAVTLNYIKYGKQLTKEDFGYLA